MVSQKSFVLSAILIVLAAPESSPCQSAPDSAHNSLSLRAGTSMPLGAWRESPPARSVNLISGSFAIEGDLEFAIANRWTLGIEGGYWSLNGSAWEDYVLGRGDAVSVSGSFAHLSLLLRPHLRVTRTDVIRMEVGPAVVFASGQEVYQGRTYPYDFLGGTSFGVQGGIEYMRVLSESVALTIKVSGLYFPAAVEYVGGRTDGMLFVPVTAGVRFLL